MKVASADIAASVEATARDLMLAAQTYQRAPMGMHLRQSLVFASERLVRRLDRQLTCLARKHLEER